MKYYDVYLVLFLKRCKNMKYSIIDSEEERKRNSFKMSNFNRKEMKMILTFSACGAYAAVLEHSKKERRKRRIWARDWLLKRKERGAYNGILSELRLTDKEDFRKFLRMNNKRITINMRNSVTPFNATSFSGSVRLLISFF